ncbi:CHAT domain-containing protein [Aspergillus cavernicola]|uniref:CHAT domain-containing protein n=1 Tax=Aspergillus cavernicola TaxID=176166 RepID=A0ABR4J156_9EURO
MGCNSLDKGVDDARLAVAALSPDDPDYADKLIELAQRFDERYGETGELSDLDQMIEIGRLIVEVSAADTPDYPENLRYYGTLLGTRFQERHETEDLQLAIETTQAALETMPKDHPSRAATLNDIALWCEIGYQATGEIEYIHSAVKFAKLAVAATPRSDPDSPVYLVNLEDFLTTRYNQLQGLEDIDAAIEAVEPAIRHMPSNHTDRGDMLNNLGRWLHERFSRTGSIDNIHRAVEHMKSALETTSNDDSGSRRRKYLMNLVINLQEIFDQTDSPEDLSHLLLAAQELISSMTDDDPERADHLDNLAIWHEKQFRRTREIEDVNRAIEFGRQAVASATNDSETCLYASHLALYLGIRFGETGCTSDIDQAIELAMSNVEASRGEDRFRYIHHFIRILWTRFRIAKTAEDITKGIMLAKDLLDTLPAEHQDRQKYRGLLSELLWVRFQNLGDPSDLDEYVDTLDTILDNGPTLPNGPGWVRASIEVGTELIKSFASGWNSEDLDRAISVYVKLAASIPHTNPYLGPILITLASWSEAKYDASKDLEDLDKSIEVSTSAAKVTEHGDDHEHIEYLGILGTHLHKRFQHTGLIDDLERGIKVTREAIEASLPTDDFRHGHLSNLAIYLRVRFEQGGNTNDLDEALRIASLAIETSPEHGPDRFACQITLSDLLNFQYRRFGEIDYLNQGIALLDLAAQGLPKNDLQWANCLNSLGNKLAARYRATGQVQDLIRSIESYEAALTGQREDSHDTTISGNLALAVEQLFQDTGDIGHLNKALQTITTAVEATRDGNVTKAPKLNNMAVILIRRFDQTGDIQDIDNAVVCIERAQKLTPENHINQISWLFTLGDAVSRRFQRTNDVADLNRAIHLSQSAIRLLASNDPERPRALHNLAGRLGLRFEHSQDIDALHEALEASSEAVKAMPVNDIYRPMALAEYSNLLEHRYDRLGSVEDLNQAIGLIQQAVDTTLSDNIQRPNYLMQLANKLKVRFERTGGIEDIDRAIEICRISVDTTPANNPDRPRRLGALANALGAGFQRTRNIETLNESVKALTEAAESATNSLFRRAILHSNLANILQQRYDALGDEADLNHAIGLLDAAIEYIPSSHDNGHRIFNSLAGLSISHFRHSGLIQDLDKACEITLRGSEETPANHPNKAIYLRNLGLFLTWRFENTSASEDLNRCVEVLKEGWSCKNARPTVRADCAVLLGVMLAADARWKEAVVFCRAGLALLPMISLLSLSNSDKQHMLVRFNGVATMAAATALNSGETTHEALELLELGRGVIASLLLDMRTDISDLADRLPDLANQFLNIRGALDTPEDTRFSATTSESSAWELRSKERREKEEKFHDICDRIRSEDGFENFLRPPTAEQMMAAASLGNIVVINVNPIRSDAFIITPKGIMTIALPKLDFEQAENIAQKLQTPPMYGNHMISWILEWAWDVVAEPCLEALNIHEPPTEDSMARIWWVLTGPLSHLPIHAAGRHGTGCNKTVMDRAMSSYSSSIKALLHGRSRVKSNAEEISKALLVSMDTTAGQRPLPFAGDEIAMLQGLCQQLQLEAVHPEQKRKQDVLTMLQTCSIFHFAGHGKSHSSNPSKSCLLLDDWQTNPLCVADLRDNWLQGRSPFLAYLSACSTGSSNNDSLADEAVHLVSACQLAGFRHVIGTLWAVSDRHCLNVTRTFYETLQKEGTTDHAVCKGLHEAVLHLRNMDLKSRETRAIKTTRQPLNPFLEWRSVTSSAQRPAEIAPPSKTSLSRYIGLLRPRDQWHTHELLSQELRESFPRDSLSPEPDAMLEVYSHERDAKFCDDDEAEEVPTLSPLLWAPYFHFGV